ncbi:MAG: isoprenylcysteine carboxylmethyltransferase family protein [Anaerolineales bacterium]
MTTFLRFALPVYLLVFFFAAMFWRSYKTWKETGVNPYKLGNTESAHDYNGYRFRIVLVVCFIGVAIFSLAPALYPYLAPVEWLEQPILAILSLGLLTFSLVWILIAQGQMGESWCIGIDEAVKTSLVESGLFRVSRNPFFLGMRIMLVGFFLVIPNSATLAIWAVGDVLVQIQVRLEEAYLRESHGNLYAAYCFCVRRWL